MGGAPGEAPGGPPPQPQLYATYPQPQPVAYPGYPGGTPPVPSPHSQSFSAPGPQPHPGYPSAAGAAALGPQVQSFSVPQPAPAPYPVYPSGAPPQHQIFSNAPQPMPNPAPAPYPGYAAGPRPPAPLSQSFSGTPQLVQYPYAAGCTAGGTAASAAKPQPIYVMQPMQAPRNEWGSGLYSCCDDIGSCMLAWCLPCVLYGQISERLGGDCCGDGCAYCLLLYCLGCPCFLSFGTRRKLRQNYNLPDEPCNDFCVHCWCECCALAQEFRELDARQTQPVGGMAPPPQQVMMH